MQKHYSDLTVLIATKDRLSQITKLLTSLENSTSLPGNVVVVYNGVDVQSLTKVFSSKFNLKVINSYIASQVMQKQIGLKSLPDRTRWVLFLDDDVIIEPTAIESLFQTYIFNTNYKNYMGFGLAIKNREYREVHKLVKFFLHAFKLYSFKPGCVTKGGHPQAYLSQKIACDVQWLNGLSLWAIEATTFYHHISYVNSYAAYEDVMYSYDVSRTQKLVFAADCYVSDQEPENNKALTQEQFMAGAIARYIFVSSHPEMSFVWLIIGQLIRNIDFCLRSSSDGKLYRRIMLSIKVLYQIVLAKSSKPHHQKLLKRNNK